jgi:hypothetical protein
VSQQLIPRFCSKEELLATLDDIRARLAADDSFEGSLSWEFPWPDDPDGQGFRVRASFRIGNSMGQGGMRMIGEWAEIPANE